MLSTVHYDFDMDRGVEYVSRSFFCSFRWLVPTVVFFVMLSLSPATFARELGIYFKDGLGVTITTPIDIRLSLWDSSELREGDVNEDDGLINVDALHYSEYQYELTTTPAEMGLYYLKTDDLPDFPTIGTTNYILQVEYKDQGAPLTSYQVYDFVNDPPFMNINRYIIVDSVSYYSADAGPRTSYNSFTIDANNNSTTTVVLKFGELLDKELLYSKTNTRFELTDSLVISGSLTTTGITSTGTINFSSASVGIGTATPVSALEVADGYYAQFSDRNAGAPPVGDCDSDAEFGRISSDNTNHRLYICQGATRGWDYADLVD